VETGAMNVQTDMKADSPAAKFATMNKTGSARFYAASALVIATVVLGLIKLPGIS
jgi:hypothetical protein